MPGIKFSGLTPLGYWMANNDPGPFKNIAVHEKPDVIEVLIEYSEGKDVEISNGAGDTPIHEVNQPSHHNFP